MCLAVLRELIESRGHAVGHVAEAHEQVCSLIRQAGSEAGQVEVGFSKNWTHFQPHQQDSPWDAAVAAFTHAQLNSFVLNRFQGKAGKSQATFLGLNYYGRIRFKNLKPLIPAAGFSCDHLARMGLECDDMLERHPAGLESALLDIYRQCGLPIYITEHGSASTDEAFRERDLKRNLLALHRAIGRGVDIRGFYYWSLLDNFEWQFGYSKEFGLRSVDFRDEKLPRKLKPLARVYGQICASNLIESPQ